MLLCALVVPGTAVAAERTVQVASFARLRVEAPVEVSVVAGPPRATIAGDARSLDYLDVRGDGNIVTVRLRAGGPPRTSPLQVTLSTPTLAAVSAGGGAKVRASGLKADRVELVLAGSGTLQADAIDAAQLQLVIAGNGAATVAGRAGLAKIAVTGSGDFDATGLVAGDLLLNADGAGDTRVTARYTARVSNNGAGQVIVGGHPKCTLLPGSRGAVRCGDPAP